MTIFFVLQENENKLETSLLLYKLRSLATGQEHCNGMAGPVEAWRNHPAIP